MRTADLIIVGAGLAGSATARAATRRGLDVVVLEAFTPGHKNGSSHGSTRIFRRVYSDPCYVEMTGRAGELWRQLENESGQTLLRVTGGVDFGPVRDPLRLHETLTACGVPASLLHADEARERWPGFRFDGPVLFHPEAGVLDPDRAMAVMIASAVAGGADVRFGTPVVSVSVSGSGGAPGRDGVRAVIRTADEEFTTPVAVIAAGAWLEPLMGGLISLPPLAITQEQILHLPRRVSNPADPWPAFIFEDDVTCFYGLLGGRDGGVPGAAVKIGEHHAGKPVTATGRDFTPDPARRQRVLDFARRRLPGLDVPSGDADSSGELREATCLYTTTANEDFILDRQGPFVIASPCSGHGAKFAPLLGEIITDLAQGRPSPDPRFTLEVARAAARDASRHSGHA